MLDNPNITKNNISSIEICINTVISVYNTDCYGKITRRAYIIVVGRKIFSPVFKVIGLFVLNTKVEDHFGVKMGTHEKLSASLEDYLEAIFQIVAKKKIARSKDISERLNVSNSSVTGALRTLAEKQLVNYVPYNVVTLTEKGKQVAAEVVHRHESLKDFLVKILAVEEEPADETACKLEHVIPEEILDKIVKFVQFIRYMENCPLTKNCPRAMDSWVRNFREYCRGGRSLKDCEKKLTSSFQQGKDRP